MKWLSIPEANARWLGARSTAHCEIRAVLDPGGSQAGPSRSARASLRGQSLPTHGARRSQIALLEPGRENDSKETHPSKRVQDSIPSYQVRVQRTARAQPPEASARTRSATTGTSAPPCADRPCPDSRVSHLEILARAYGRARSPRGLSAARPRGDPGLASGREFSFPSRFG